MTGTAIAITVVLGTLAWLIIGGLVGALYLMVYVPEGSDYSGDDELAALFVGIFWPVTMIGVLPYSIMKFTVRRLGKRSSGSWYSREG